ncbi:sugar ABC transporter ATP-binding protein [Polaromonas sp. JS666]|uniref:sugar ABC transporter ATP-binding protein n=1 Tax=Polaromonas sp. (strain JS666 / ATCC BAA-500) TaxID=296591 RepID=UPI00088AF35A|nr:sugar ABC transporter ATP-binding protein [Polaromonas sp. JS666]SDO08483.1 monosaccharide ABC transporter ATP-binding protein, CUT2 family [Polaromonas sp. JS666]
MNPDVGFQQVTKRFGPVQVLHGVSFAFAPGRVYGVLGENGAGKSTLMKILAGYEPASEGSVEIGGQAVSFRGPRDAEAEGIVMIHQEFNLADDLSIAQNIFLGHELTRHGLLDERAMARRAEAAMRSVGLACDPGRRVRDLIVAEKQLVEIAKALSRNARVLVMDEPTATLTPSETERLFALIAQLRGQGATVLYISHKLDEVERITDEVLVMRDGRLVAHRPTGSVTRQQMASLMVGRELSDLFPPRQPVPEGAQALLKVRDLQVPGWAQDVSFQVRAGEILGFAGLVGAGRTELFEGLLGLRPASCAAVDIAGRPWTRRSPRSASRLGLTYLSEDRKGRGLHLRMGVPENLTLMALERYAQPWLDPAAERAALKQASEAFGIRAAAGVPASALSGGNQQKLALARVLQPQPQVVVLDEPTRGVDVGAKRDIYFLIRRLADEGRAVVIVSSELLELIGLCHRVIVMRQGRMAAELPQDQLTEELLIAHATGTH